MAGPAGAEGSVDDRILTSECPTYAEHSFKSSFLLTLDVAKLTLYV